MKLHSSETLQNKIKLSLDIFFTSSSTRLEIPGFNVRRKRDKAISTKRLCSASGYSYAITNCSHIKVTFTTSFTGSFARWDDTLQFVWPDLEREEHSEPYYILQLPCYLNCVTGTQGWELGIKHWFLLESNQLFMK